MSAHTCGSSARAFWSSLDRVKTGSRVAPFWWIASDNADIVALFCCWRMDQPDGVGVAVRNH